MNSRTTLFLIVLVALVGGFVLWDHYKGTTTERYRSKSTRIVDFDPNDVTGIDLVRSNQTIVLEKSGDNWALKQPLIARADASAVNSILNEIEFAERTRTVTEKELQGVGLADFGLDTPIIRVTLHGKKRPIGLLVGRETPTKDALYVQVEGHKEVYVARKSVQERLSQSVDAIRSRATIEVTPSAVTRLEIKAADRIIEVSRAAITTNVETRWTVTRPLVARADQGRVSELLTDLGELRIQDFVSEDPKDLHTYLLDEPDREVTVVTGDATKTLVLSKPLTNDAAKVYAKLKDGSSIFTVSTDVTKKFAFQVNDLRESRVLTFSEDAVKGIEILRGQDKIALADDDKGWKITAPIAVTGDDNAVRQFLRDLGNVRATQFVADVATDLDRYGLATPGMTVSLWGGETNLLSQLLVGGFDASLGIRYVKRADEPFVYGVGSNALDRIPDNYGVLRNRQVFDLKPDQITRVSVGGVTVARDAEGKWKLVEPPQGVFNTERIQIVLAVLCRLRVESFGRARTEQDAGLGTTIKVTVGDSTHWLSVAKDGQAAADQCELTFKLAQPVVQTLTKDIVSTPTNAPPASP